MNLPIRNAEEPLLFEELAYNSNYKENYLEQNHDYNNLCHNFDYEKQLGGDLIFVNLDE